MFSFRDQPIQRKFIWALMSTCAITLILSSTALLIEDYYTFRSGIVRELSSKASITADNVSSLLAFEDAESASNALSVLKSDIHIRVAAIYDSNEQIFATYKRSDTSDATFPTKVPEESHRFIENRLELFLPITLGERTIGSVFLQSDLNELDERLIRFLIIIAFVFNVALFLAYWLATYFKRLITDPIQRLASTAKQVSHDKDYSARVTSENRDELGTLVKTFNDMLQQIGESDASLRSEIVDRKRAESQVRTLNEELEDRVRKRTIELEAAVKELESFSYSVSHDLRAPLRGIYGWSLALVEDFGDQLNETAHDYIGRVRSEASRMGELIEDLLKLSRLTQAHMSITQVDMSAIAQDIANRLQALEPERKVEWKISPSLSTQGDSGLLHAAISNLIGNAWKFSSKRDVTEIEFGKETSNGETVYFIRDNGAGFDPAIATKLFSPFQRLHKQSEFPGNGIGLANVQRIVKRHGGRIWAESSLNQGACFYFTLPLSKEPANPSSQ